MARLCPALIVPSSVHVPACCCSTTVGESVRISIRERNSWEFLIETESSGFRILRNPDPGVIFANSRPDTNPTNVTFIFSKTLKTLK